jgi:hypothetical protein
MCILIDQLSLDVALGLVLGLLHETSPLIDGVVELGVCIGNLLGAHKDFEALAEAGNCAVGLGEG